MIPSRVLIVEDDAFIALDEETTLADSGWDVCGVAATQDEALALGTATRPPFAVVDVRLAPGDGRIVARELLRKYGTAVLFTSAHCDDIQDLARTGALACLPKPFQAADLPDALEALDKLRQGKSARLPDRMKVFSPAERPIDGA